MTTYTITVQGHLATHWSEWFDGLAISHKLDGNSTLSGEIRGQAALHNVLKKLFDLNLPLVSVKRVNVKLE